MLPEELELIARDKSIANLSLAYDDQAMGVVLKRLLPSAQFESIVKEYIRYKPETSCLISYRLIGSNEITSLYVVLYNKINPDKLPQTAVDSSEVLKVAVCHDLALVVYPFPFDRRLPYLSLLSDKNSCDELLGTCLYDDASFSTAHIDVLQYKPERRFVAKFIDSDGNQLVIKHYSKQRFEQASIAKRFKIKGRFLVKTLGKSKPHKVLVFDWVDGVCLADVLGNGLDTKVLSRVGGYWLSFMVAELSVLGPSKQ